jgi:formylmethanofuran dehydrogenase subunit C
MALQRKLYSEDLFDQLSGEKEQKKDRKFQSGKDKTLERLIGKTGRGGFLDFTGVNLGNYGLDIAVKAGEYIPGSLMYTANDVEKFSIALNQFQENIEYFSEYAGAYLSALIEKCQEPNLIIHTSHLTVPLENIGYQNSNKNIIVNGDVGDWVGYEMCGGSIHVRGNGKNNVGYKMEDGIIIIEGNVDTWGGNMGGGTIIIKGERMGRMTDPQSDVWSTDEREILGGDVYHRDKLIVKDGEMVE